MLPILLLLNTKCIINSKRRHVLDLYAFIMLLKPISTPEFYSNLLVPSQRISSLVIAYHKSANMSQVSLWLSTDGGLEFSKIAPELPLKVC